MTWSKSTSSSRDHADRALRAIIAAGAAATAALLLLVVAFLVGEAWPVLKEVGIARLIGDDGWYPLDDGYGLTPMLVATLVVGTGAVVLATPLGVAVAVCRRFLAPAPFAALLGRGLTVFAGLPSVVYGLVGLSVLVPWIAAWQPPGASVLAATLVLAAMVLPTIAISADGALAAVPPEYLHGAAALGMTRARTVFGVLLPAAAHGVAAGVVLAFARALGETLAVVMVAGNVVQLPRGLFDPVRTLTANIALEMAYATGTHRSALFASGLALMVLVLGLAALGRVRRQAG